MEINKKRILITGGCGGIGSALLKLFAEKGSEVFSFDIKNPRKKIKNVKYFKIDVTKEKEIEKGLKKIGKFDILINNAGVLRRGTIFESSEKDFDSIVDVNLKGSWLMIKDSEKYLNKNGMIVQISSKHALLLSPNPGIYALSKDSAISLAEIVKNTNKHYKIKIVYSGPVETPLANKGLSKEEISKRKKKRISPEEMASKILKLIKSKKEILQYNYEKNKYVFK